MSNVADRVDDLIMRVDWLQGELARTAILVEKLTSLNESMTGVICHMLDVDPKDFIMSRDTERRDNK